MRGRTGRRRIVEPRFERRMIRQNQIRQRARFIDKTSETRNERNFARRRRARPRQAALRIPDSRRKAAELSLHRTLDANAICQRMHGSSCDVSLRRCGSRLPGLQDSSWTRKEFRPALPTLPSSSFSAFTASALKKPLVCAVAASPIIATAGAFAAASRAIRVIVAAGTPICVCNLFGRVICQAAATIRRISAACRPPRAAGPQLFGEGSRAPGQARTFLPCPVGTESIHLRSRRSVTCAVPPAQTSRADPRVPCASGRSQSTAPPANSRSPGNPRRRKSHSSIAPKSTVGGDAMIETSSDLLRAPLRRRKIQIPLAANS